MRVYCNRYFLLYAWFKIFYCHFGFLRKEWCQHYIEKSCEWKQCPSAVLYKADIGMYLHILLPSLPTHQGRDGPEGTVWSTRTQRTYRKTWKTRQTSRTTVFPYSVTQGIYVVVTYELSWCYTLYHTESRPKPWNTSHAWTGYAGGKASALRLEPYL